LVVLPKCERFKRLALNGVRIAEPSEMELSFDVDIDKLGWNRNVFVGIVASQTDQERHFGVLLSHQGGRGLQVRRAGIVWGELQRSAVKLEEGRSYRITLLRTSDGRVHLRAEDRSVVAPSADPGSPAAPGGARLLASHPRYEPEQPLGESCRPPKEPAPPLNVGGYDLAILEVDLEERLSRADIPETETRLTLRGIELRLAPAIAFPATSVPGTAEPVAK